jgi:hypothetical protein
MELRIPIELANQIIGYLATKPYQEVFQLIDGLKEAAKPPQPPKEQENG